MVCALVLSAAPCRALDDFAPAAKCWRVGAEVAGRVVDYAQVENPARNFTVLRAPKRFADVADAGVVVANGTFFASRLAALGDVLTPGAPPYAFPKRVIRTKDGRLVDLERRWGLGLRRDSGRLAVARGEDAAAEMSTYLGGAGLLLAGGADASAQNWGDPETPGPNFPEEYRTRRAGRIALGVKEVDGNQVLLVLAVPPEPGTTAPELAGIMRALGATDAVFYDGGGALGFAAGPPGAKDALILPTNPGEDENPTHIVIPACR